MEGAPGGGHVPLVAPCGPPLQLSLGLRLRVGEKLALVNMSFHELLQNNFSKTKNRQKIGTGTGHIINRLVSRNRILPRFIYKTT